MDNLSFLELNTVYSETHIKLHSYFKNENHERIGELEIYLFDEYIEDIKEASQHLDPVVTDTVNSFQITYNDHINDLTNETLDKTPYIIWGRVALISRFYIYPEYRGRGYGGQTLYKLIKTIKDVYRADFIILKPYPLFGTEDESIIEEVPTKKVISKHIHSLISFYEKHGFKTQKINKKYYQHLCLII